jgi:hypothetical protein
VRRPARVWMGHLHLVYLFTSTCCEWHAASCCSRALLVRQRRCIFCRRSVEEEDSGPVRRRTRIHPHAPWPACTLPAQPAVPQQQPVQALPPAAAATVATATGTTACPARLPQQPAAAPLHQEQPRARADRRRARPRERVRPRYPLSQRYPPLHLRHRRLPLLLTPRMTASLSRPGAVWRRAPRQGPAGR